MFNPLENNYSIISLETSVVLLFEFTYDGIPKTEGKLLRHFLAVADVISFSGKSNGNLEYPSMAVNMFFYLEEGMGPLKYIDSLVELL